MPAPVTIRPARAGDLAAVASLLGRLEALHARLRPDFFRDPQLSAATRGGGADPRATDGLTAILYDRSAALLVAEIDDVVRGVACVRLYDTPADLTHLPRRRLHVDSLIVDEGARLGGVGRKLMGAAEAWGRARGAEQVLLTVWSGNEAAERFYRALGYGPSSQVLSRELP